MEFSASRRKVERAMKHINDLNEIKTAFSESDFYSVSVEEYKGSNHIFIEFKKQFPQTDASIIIGDSLNNLRSALDILFFQAIQETTGAADDWTKFPFRKSREELISAIDGGLKKKGVSNDPSTIKIRNVIVDVIKPYETGNATLWALHDMNITDKHQLLIPLFKVMRFRDICLEDEKKEAFITNQFFTDNSYRFPLNRKGIFTVKDKGHAATEIVFDITVPFMNYPVIPALNEMAECVTRAIGAFDELGLRGFSV